MAWGVWLVFDRPFSLGNSLFHVIPSAAGECVPSAKNKLNCMPLRVSSKTPLPLPLFSYANPAAPRRLSTAGSVVNIKLLHFPG